MMSVVDIHIYVNIHTYYVCTIYIIYHIPPYIHQTYQMPFVLFSASPSKRRCWTLFWMPRIRAWCHQKLVSSTVSTSTFLVLLHLWAQIPTKMGKRNMGSLCFTQSVEPFRYFLGNLEDEALKFHGFHGAAVPAAHISSHLNPFTYLPRSSKFISK